MRISDWSSDVCSSDLQVRGKENGQYLRGGIAGQPVRRPSAARRTRSLRGARLRLRSGQWKHRARPYHLYAGGGVTDALSGTGARRGLPLSRAEAGRPGFVRTGFRRGGGAVERVERLDDLGGLRASETVVDRLALAAGADQPVLAEQRQLLGDRRVPHLQKPRQLAHRLFAAEPVAGQEEPVAARQRLERS